MGVVCLLFLIVESGVSPEVTAKANVFNTSQTEKIIDSKSLEYSDDTITTRLSLLINNLRLSEDVPSSALDYLSMSTTFLDAQEYKNALDAALIAYHLSKNEENFDLKISSLLIISQINVFWNNPETGISIYDRVDELLTEQRVEVEVQLQFLLLLGKSNAYLKLNNPDEALKIIEKAFNLAPVITNKTIYNEFVWNTGHAFFQKGEYQMAFDNFEKAVSNSGSTYFKFLSKFYKAQFLQSEGNTEEAVNLYLEIDSLLAFQDERFPERKDIYNAINDYYQLKDDRASQFLYLNKFLREINSYSETTFYIQKNTSEFFVIPEMIRKKQTEIDLLKSSKFRNILILIVICVLLFIALFLLYFQYKRNKLYQERFKKLMSESQDANAEKRDSNSSDLSVETISEILQKLDKFEKNKEFLDKTISLHEISKQFNTNSTYLSKVVNLKKDKNFSNYINQLRIEYCLSLLKADKKVQNYSIKAIAEECGFNTAQSFSNAFFKYTGIYPSYFIEQLKKTDKN
jgi:AraC-like DNA-binding protein